MVPSYIVDVLSPKIIINVLVTNLIILVLAYPKMNDHISLNERLLNDKIEHAEGKYAASVLAQSLRNDILDGNMSPIESWDHWEKNKWSAQTAAATIVCSSSIIFEAVLESHIINRQNLEHICIMSERAPF
jgi:hypothetical protein